MKLTRYTDFALRVLIYLALNPDRQTSIAEIAEGYGVSENHLMKVVQQLAREGLVASTRGRGGGLRLGKAPADIRIGAVVRLTEPDMDLAECGSCVISGVCGLTSVFGRATEAFLHTLDGVTLADVIRSGDRLTALLRLGLSPKHRKERPDRRIAGQRRANPARDAGRLRRLP
jgi:Rrf2 family nitric oxide-sensitive transcriptional repressor